MPSHVTPEFQLHPSNAHLHILQVLKAHIYKTAHYLIHPELSLVPPSYPLK